MKKTILVFLILLSCSYSMALYSATCNAFAFTTKDGLTKVDQNSVEVFAAAAKADSKQIDEIYNCIKSATASALAGTDATVYKDVLRQAATLEAEVRSFIAVLSTATTAVDPAVPSKTLVYTTRVYKISDKALEFKSYSTKAKDIADKLPGITYGVMAQNNAGQAECIGTKEDFVNLNDEYKKAHSKDAPAESVIGTNAKAAGDDVIKANAAKYYADDETGAAKFKTDITNKKFDVAAVDASTKATPPTASTTPTTASTTTPSVVNVNTGKDNKTAADANAADIKANKDLLDKILLAQATKEKTTTPTTVATTTPSSSSGGGDIGGQSKSFELDRAKREKDMEERQRQQKIQAMLRDAKLRTKLPKSSSLSYQSPRASGGSSGSSLFGSKDSDEEDVSKKVTKPSIFDKVDSKDSSSTSKKGDYSSYYGSSNAPDATSSKDLALNRFSSMYEMARRKALIEDAKSEFAGRYIDIFLLQHSIIYDYYCRGLLIDVGEEVTPIGDEKTRI